MIREVTNRYAAGHMTNGLAPLYEYDFVYSWVLGYLNQANERAGTPPAKLLGAGTSCNMSTFQRFRQVTATKRLLGGVPAYSLV